MSRFESPHEFLVCSATLVDGISNEKPYCLSAVEVSVERDEPMKEANHQLFVMSWTDYLHNSFIYASPQILVENICQKSGYLLAHFKTKKRYQHKSTEQAGTVVML